MSDEQKERPADGQNPGRSGENEQPEPEGQQEEQPRITLDRYLSRRRPPLRSTWSQVASLVLMLIALIMIFAYKNRCGLAVADFFGGGGEHQAPPAAR